MLVSSGAIILWQFRHALPQSRERQALRLIGASFFGLAVYVTYESVRAVVGSAEPDASPMGIGLAATSLVNMPWLSVAQRRTGTALHRGALSLTRSRPSSAPTSPQCYSSGSS